MRRKGCEMQKLLPTILVALSACVLSTSAMAGPLCAGAMFTCQTLEETTSGEKKRVYRGKNLRQLVDDAKSLRWVKRHCQLVDRDPFDCDWRKSIRVRTLASKKTAKPPRSPTSPPAKIARAARRAAAKAPTVQPAPIRAPVSQAKKRPFGDHVRAAALRYKLPADFIAAVMTVESGANPKAVSQVGAQGLMQLMPDTAKAMGVQDPWDPAQNIMGGARFLRILANRFRGDLVKVLSGYHAGSTRVKKRKGTPFSQTDRYVRKVLRVYYALRDG